MVVAPVAAMALILSATFARSGKPMKTRINDPIHNPFYNRFHVPVHSRLDEMQAYTHMAWLHSPYERTSRRKQTSTRDTTRAHLPARLRWCWSSCFPRLCLLANFANRMTLSSVLKHVAFQPTYAILQVSRTGRVRRRFFPQPNPTSASSLQN